MATQLNNWLSIDKTSGTGNAEITLTASSYEELVDRTTSLKIQGISKNAILTVRQNAFVPPLTNAYFWVKLEEDGEIYGIVNNTIEYSFNQSTWNSFPISSSLSVPANTYVWFRNTVDLLNKEYVQDGNRFLFTKNGCVGGDLSSMGAMMEKNFQYLFAKENHTTNTYLIDASELILPWDTVSNRCFYDMFRDCSKLITPPKVLPATNLEGACYIGMFDGCKSLTTAPELPATTLSVSYQDGQTYGCYQSMFGNCSSLITAPKLPATTLADSCYYYMFFNCTSLVNAPELPATTLAKECYSLMFSGCSSLKIAPELPATTLANKCYSYMFSDCTSLVNAPELPATTLANYCYSYMFNGCSSLKIAPELPATTLAYGCYRYMFLNCTSLVNAPELPATTLADSCYSYMFKDCTNLSYIKMLATEIDDNLSPLTGWVTNVAPTGTFVKAAANTNIQIDSNSGIPIGWTVYNEGDPNIPNHLKQKYFWVEFETSNGTISGLTNDYTDMYHSFDGTTWLTTPNTLSMGNNTLVYFKNNSKKISDETLRLNINFNSNAKVGGDLSSITDMADYACAELFDDNRHLTDASNLVLPWETIGKSSFYNMFAICTELKYPPIIKATKLGVGSCRQMFFNCHSLLRTPILLTPSNNFIPRAAYSRMFYGCSSLVEVCDLNALRVGDEGYNEMFYECTSLETAPYINAEDLSYTTIPSGWPNVRGKHMYCMFIRCKRLKNVQSVLKANLAEECYKWMYRECSSLKIAPSLPQHTLTTRCYYGMFENCTSLIYVKMLGSGNYEIKYVNGVPTETDLSWFLLNVKTKGGTFVKHPDSKLTVDAPYGGGIPKDWNVETATE